LSIKSIAKVIGNYTHIREYLEPVLDIKKGDGGNRSELVFSLIGGLVFKEGDLWINKKGAPEEPRCIKDCL
jgi:hypothetical protein